MDVIYGLIPGMIFLGLLGVVVFFIAAKSGQFDDLEGAAHRILMDEDDPKLPRKREADATPGDGEAAAGKTESDTGSERSGT